MKKYYSGKIIPEIELNTTVLEIPIEVLGYNIDTELMQESLKGIYLAPEERKYFLLWLMNKVKKKLINVF